jgi:2,5-furandicarboxylate decarboxylase 1
MPQDLRSFVADYERHSPADVVRVTEPVDRVAELQAITEELDRRNAHPILVFEDVRDSALPIVTNVLASRAALAYALGTTRDDVREVYARKLNELIPATVRERPAGSAATFVGGDADLARLPIPTYFPNDAAPYITSGLTVAHDPDSDGMTMGFHRYQLKGPRKLGVSLHSKRRMFEFHRRAEEAGKNLPAALCIGLHPAFALGALSYPQSGASKLDVVGGLLGEPVELVRCATIDVNVPATADIVVEGHILADVREPEGPFGEFTGYFSERSTQNVFVVDAITLRSGAWYQSIAGGRAADHVSSLGLAREGAIANNLRRTIPNVVDVSVPNSGCSSFLAFVSIRQTRAGEAKHAIAATLGTDHYLKGVIVVDEDVDVQSEKDVFWAIATRCRFDRDLVTISDSLGTVLDPVATDAGLTSKFGLDATRPYGEKFAQSLVIEPAAAQRAREIVGRLFDGRNGCDAPNSDTPQPEDLVRTEET